MTVFKELTNTIENSDLMKAVIKNIEKEEEKEQETFNATAGRIRSFVERAERILEEKKALSEDLSEIWKEAKGEGFDLDALKAIVKIRAKDAGDVAEADAILDTYKSALNMS